MKVVSVCVKCHHQNTHEVDHNGSATATCESCSTVYDVQTYEVRAKGGRRDRKTGIKRYSIRVKEPDRDETLLEFDSKHEIEARSGDWITGSYLKGKLKYIINHNINRYWDIQQGIGCLLALILIATVSLSIVSFIVVILIL